MNTNSGEIGAGLTTSQVLAKRAEVGPNAIPEPASQPFLVFLQKFWAPVPWMLEFTFAFELLLGKVTQSIIIAFLLVFNAVLSYVQERRANDALALLRQRLTITVRALRDGQWRQIASQELVPGDVIHVRVGDFIPADIRIQQGQILVDQSSLTGESTPKDRGSAQLAFAGSVIRRGEATGEVSATGLRTAFGKSAELVRTAASPSRLESLVFTIVKHLIAIDLILAAIILLYAVAGGIPLIEIIPFALILLVASVPVALPATYTLASALGSLDLSKRGVLVTRLSAVEEAAEMDVLCCDKTGTMTRNQLAVASVRAYAPCDEKELIRLAALACDESTQDPIDLAVLEAASKNGHSAAPPGRVRFLPFDPSTKRSEAIVGQGERALHVIKGAPQIVATLAPVDDDAMADADAMAQQGCRVLAVAAGPEGQPRLAGLIGLSDPPRDDSAAVLRELSELGIRVIMVTGDSEATARTIAAQVGIGGRTCSAEVLHEADISPHLDCAVFAGVFPEDKFRLVHTLQVAGHVVGMTGDGVNDAPALKQADVGIAVANATDVAKAAASLVLTRPGLSDIRAAVEAGRCIHQRMLTYVLNKIAKTIQIALLLSLGLLIAGVFVTTPRLILLLLFANDFVTMSLAGDRVTISRHPDRWRIGSLTWSALVIAFTWLIVTFALFFWGRDSLLLELPQLQTLVFIALVFTGQATVYLVRDRRHLWHSAPGLWLLVASTGAILTVSLLASTGILMAAIHPTLVLGVLALIAACTIALDFVKVHVFGYYKLR